MMNLTLSPRAQAKLGVTNGATAAQVIASLDRLVATATARGQSPASTTHGPAVAGRSRSMEQQIDALSDDEVLALIGISSGGAAAEHAIGGPPSLTGLDIGALTDDQIAELWS